MTVSDEFTAKTEHIRRQLSEIAGANDWREDMRAAFLSHSFTPQQEEALHNAGTPTCFHNIGGMGDDPLPVQLTHAFSDPIGNSAMMIGMLRSDDDLLLQVMVKLRHAIEDDCHNYPIIMGDDLPGSVQKVLDQYDEELLPQINEAIEELVRRTGKDPATIPPAVDWQHMSKLSPELF